MPRKPTMIGETRKWIRENRDWLGRDHAPMLQQLKMLAETQDLELRTNGRVQSATASAYRHAFAAVLAMKPDADDLPVPSPQPPPAAGAEQAAEDEDDELFGPGR